MENIEIEPASDGKDYLIHMSQNGRPTQVSEYKPVTRMAPNHYDLVNDVSKHFSRKNIRNLLLASAIAFSSAGLLITREEAPVKLTASAAILASLTKLVYSTKRDASAESEICSRINELDRTR